MLPLIDEGLATGLQGVGDAVGGHLEAGPVARIGADQQPVDNGLAQRTAGLIAQQDT